MNLNKYCVVVALLVATLFSSPVMAQNAAIARVEPPNWWIGMHNTTLQLMVYGPAISKTEVSISYPGVRLAKTIKAESPNYLFLDLVIDPKTAPGNVPIVFKTGKKVVTWQYQLMAREAGSANRQGFNSADAIYLIMPDRFANGDPLNDSQPDMIEKGNHGKLNGRHGGDLKGIIDHLDYIHDLGFTSIWNTPLLENNQDSGAYHGYAITDFYRIDPRMGTNDQYRQFVADCKAKEMKVIMDMVFNHCGSNHWWMKDLPCNDWINQFPEYTRSNFRISTVSDAHGAAADRDLNFRGWFDTIMPDLNLQNVLLLNYMVQNSIWWIEYAGLQGIRIDTYPYPDKIGMQQWNIRISEEYPNLNSVGEVWIPSAAKLNYWQKDALNRDGFNTHLPALMDFPMMEALKRAFNEKDGWDDGTMRLYNVLADDFLYANSDNLVVFAENHDVGRVMSYYNNDVRKFKMCMAFIATVRGIPQLYYGSEILFNGNRDVDDEYIREDFTGGWPGDPVNTFIPDGRTAQQNDAFNYLSKLLNYRKNAEVLQTGKLIQFVPQDELYVYFRVLNDKAVMVILNNAETGIKTFQSQRYAEVLKDFSKGTNIITGEHLATLEGLTLNAKSATVIELNP